MCNVCDAGRVIGQRDHARFQVGPATLFVSARAVDDVEMRSEFTPCEVKVRRELPEREPVETPWTRVEDLAGVMSLLGTDIRFECFKEYDTAPGYLWVTGQTDELRWPSPRVPTKPPRGWKKAWSKAARAGTLRKAKNFEKLLGVPASVVQVRRARFDWWGHTIWIFSWGVNITKGPLKGLRGKPRDVAAAVRAYEAALNKGLLDKEAVPG